MLAMWRAQYSDGTSLTGPPPGTTSINRSMLKGFSVYWGPNEQSLRFMEVAVPQGVRLVYRRRRSTEGLDMVLVALENKDRSHAQIWVLYCEGDEPMVWRQSEWVGPNMWPPKLESSEV